jgi:hypothetical protein
MRKLFVGTRAGVIAVVLAATVAVAGPASAAEAPRNGEQPASRPVSAP